MQFSRTVRRSGPWIAIFAALALLTALLPTLGSRAADHLDAPGLTPPSGEPAADIADLYAFAGSSETTVIAFTVPAFTADAAFGSDFLYEVKVSTNGDAVEEESYEFTFSDVRSDGAQFVIAQHAEGEAATNGSADGALVGFGQVGNELSMTNGGTFWAGYRSDPFFFDLAGFQGTVEGDGDRTLNDGNENDFFEPLDVLAVVMEVPDYESAINIWVTTSDADGNQIDRIGRPAINTVVNSKAFGDETDKNVFNQAEPADDVANFETKVEDVLMALSAGDTEGAYTECQADAVAGVLLPDVLPFDKDGTLPPPLNGRALADDVIDTELRVLTGGDPLELFPEQLCGGDVARDADGAINTDSIGPHTDYLSEFPYLGAPHGSYTMPELGAENFAASLSGSNEVPPVATDASGLTSLSADSNSVDHLSLVYDLTSAMQAHIHVGDPDKNGPVVAFLYGPTGGENIDGRLSSGSIGSSDLVAGTMADLIDVMSGSFAYVNVHTTANPAGEVRGQISPLNVVTDRFVDDDDSVHESNIDIIAAAGITLGCNPPTNDEFCGDEDISRGQMAAFMDRGLNLPEGSEDFFNDDDTSIFEAHIDAMAEASITFGCNPPTNDEYCPEDSVTRGQMAAFINRALDLPDTSEDFFTDDESSIFEGDINRLAAAGITLGCNPPTNDEYCPEADVTRAQMATFLARAFGWGS